MCLSRASPRRQASGPIWSIPRLRYPPRDCYYRGRLGPNPESPWACQRERRQPVAERGHGARRDRHGGLGAHPPAGWSRLGGHVLGAWGEGSKLAQRGRPFDVTATQLGWLLPRGRRPEIMNSGLWCVRRLGRSLAWASLMISWRRKNCGVGRQKSVRPNRGGEAGVLLPPANRRLPADRGVPCRFNRAPRGV